MKTTNEKYTLIECKDNKAPQIYIADLACYNEGELRGVWIDPTDYDKETLSEAIHNWLAERGHEEFAIHDYSNFPDLGEYPSLDTIFEVVDAINEHDIDIVNAYLTIADISELEHLSERYQGEYEDLEDYAYRFCQEVYADPIPSWLENYIDYEKMAKDWKYSGDISIVEVSHNCCYVFSNNY